MKAVVAAFNQEKALVGAFSVITNLRMDFFEALVIMSTHGWARHQHNWAAELSRVLRRSDLTPDSVNVSIQNSIFKQGHCQPFQQFYIQFRFQNPGSIRNLQSLAQFYQHCSLNPLNKLWNRSKSLLFLLYFQRILDIMLIFRISSKHSPVEISHTLCFHFVSKNVKYSKLFKTCHHQITRNVKKNGGERRK